MREITVSQESFNRMMMDALRETARSSLADGDYRTWVCPEGWERAPRVEYDTPYFWLGAGADELWTLWPPAEHERD